MKAITKRGSREEKSEMTIRNWRTKKKEKEKTKKGS